ncbi:MAG: ATP-dependent zinc protease [Pseudomonadota bacterium]
MSERLVAGWREWVSLPNLGLNAIKAKLDTGARTSALHAWDIEPFTRDGEPWVSFHVHPIHRDQNEVKRCEAMLVDQRTIKSSSGTTTHRCVIRSTLRLGARDWPIELTLVNRKQMLFRLLLGRTALRDHALVDPKMSYLLSGKRPRRDKSQ